MRFLNKYLDRIYRYLYKHDQETVLIKDICKATGFSKTTVIKYVRRLERLGLISRDLKYFRIIPQ